MGVVPPSLQLGRRLRRAGHYAAASALVAATLGLRTLLQPSLGASSAFTLFYPTVIICAAVFGRRVAIFSLAASTVFAFVLFVQPHMTPATRLAELTAVGFFLFNSLFAIWLIGFLRRTLGRILAEQRDAVALARSQVDLLREVRTRTAQHLQLVAGVLSMQAKGEPSPEVAEALRRAARQSLLLSRAQMRSDLGEDDLVDVSAQAEQLVAAALAAADRPAGGIVVEPSGLRLAPEQATAMSVALMECVDALAREPARETVRVRFEEEEGALRLRIWPVNVELGTSIVTGPHGHLLRAAMDQLQGRMWLVQAPEGGSLELSVPRAGAAGLATGRTH